MNKELELWQFISSRLKNGEAVILLVVATSSGSSPGRQGFKMAVGGDGELIGSIGGGVMEVGLVEQAKADLSEPGAVATGFPASSIIERVHQRNAPNASGMICSGRQTVIMRLLTSDDAEAVDAIIVALENRTDAILTITSDRFGVLPSNDGTQNETYRFEKLSDTDFAYQERLGPENSLFIVGGGHCALALSELMSKLDFRISLFDDRPELNTLEKNHFANKITIIDGYERVGGLIPGGENIYVVVMTLGYKFDEIVVRALYGREFKYFGVIGSRAKMKMMKNVLIKDGFSSEYFDRLRTPIGIPINSHSAEEIAVSIAAEIIAVKNSA